MTLFGFFGKRHDAWRPLPAGGYGADWGIKYDADGLLVTPKEDRGPLFQGPEGQTALRAAVLEYAPLWQVRACTCVCVWCGGGVFFSRNLKRTDQENPDQPAHPRCVAVHSWCLLCGLGVRPAVGSVCAAAANTRWRHDG